MSHLLVHTNRFTYPLIGEITFPSVDVQTLFADFSVKTKKIFDGSLVYDFWTLFTKVA